MRRTIKINQFGAAVREILARKTGELRAGAHEVCERGRIDAVALTDAADKVDTGLYRKRWLVKANREGAELSNDTPYAGVIEWGRRPLQGRPPTSKASSKSSPSGAKSAVIEALQKWARRKLGLSDREALSAAIAIRRAIYLRGLPPHHIMAKTRRLMIVNWRAKVREIIRR